MLEAGSLRHRVTIERAVNTTTATGDALTQWYEYATVWAAVEPLTGRERLLADQSSPELTHRVTMRWIRNVTPSCRLRLSDRTLNISSVVNVDERFERMHLMCSEEVES